MRKERKPNGSYRLAIDRREGHEKLSKSMLGAGRKDI